MRHYSEEFVGIPPSLYNDLRSALLHCGPFGTDAQLRAIFNDGRIAPWRNDLSKSDNATERVEAVIDLLYNKYNNDEENALVALLYTLIDRVQPGDACRDHLAELINKVEQVKKPKSVPIPIYVFVADDHIHAVEGLRYIINQETDMKVVGQASKKLDVLDITPTPLPDVIVLDMAWPGDMSAGISFIPQLKNKYPNAHIIAITNYPELIEPARQAGALPLRKGFSREELLDTIRYAVRAKEQLNHLVGTLLPLGEPLTEREKDVMRFLVQGMKDREIGSELSIAEGTVKKHVSNLLSKLGAKSRTEAAIIAERQRLL